MRGSQFEKETMGFSIGHRDMGMSSGQTSLIFALLNYAGWFADNILRFDVLFWHLEFWFQSIVSCRASTNITGS